MADEVGIAVVGAAGRMGRMLVRAVAETPGARLSGATVRPGHPWVGRDLGEAMGGAALGVLVEDDPLEVFARSPGGARLHHAGGDDRATPSSRRRRG